MGKGAKRKGSAYEREFRDRCRQSGLLAERVPLSGAMAGYPDDVVVEDFFRVECKFRADGFKRIYGWAEGLDVLVLPESGLTCYSMEAWARAIKARKKGVAPFFLHMGVKHATPQKVVLGYLGEASALAIRARRRPWLVLMPHIVEKM